MINHNSTFILKPYSTHNGLTMKIIFRTLLLSLAFLSLSQMAQAADYFWVGGSGDWSDISHWATASGGATRHNVVPTPNDRVFFDANSFTAAGQKVNVNNQSIFCLDMNWETVTNTPTISAPKSYVLNVYGSLKLSANMSFSFLGSVNFLASAPGNTINMAGHRIREIATFAGLGGGWTLQGAMQTDTTLFIKAGNLNTGNQNISCLKLFVIPTSAVNLNLGSSRITVTGRYYRRYEWWQQDSAVVEFNRNNLTVVPGTSVIDLSSNKPLLRATGMGTVALGTVLFSNTLGKGKFEIDNGGNATLTRLEMRNDSEIKGSASFDELVLGPGKSFVFQAGFTYKLKKLTATGLCTTPIQVFSSASGTQVTFEAPADSISGNYLSLKDIKGSGGATFLARNAADLGNNTGWTFVPKANNNLFWVGGSGNWSNPARWSFTSGGAGGACVPTAGDNVFFDANSGNSITVTIDVENAYCRNMTWTGAAGAPVLSGTADKGMHVFGSLVFVPNLKQSFLGDFFFEGANVGNTITSAGRIFNRDIYMDGSGTWTLTDSLSVFNNFYFKQGDFNTADKQVFTRNFLSRDGNTRKLTLGKTKWTLRNLDPQNYFNLEWNMNPLKLTLEASNSIIDFSNKHASMVASPTGGELKYNVVLFSGGDGSFSNGFRQRQSFDTVSCVSSLYNYGINSSNVVKMLNVNYAFQINARDTFTIGELIVPDVCTGMVELRSAGAGGQAFLNSTKALTTQRLMIQDINRIGVGTATANKSIDLGNNLGWIINEIAGRDLYWVGKGGNGDWFDPINWSLSSGGPGGECIPTAKDNVFFDANSFNGPNQRVNNYNRFAYCKNMSWTGATNNPIFSMWILNAFGSVDLPTKTPGSSISEISFRSPEKDRMIQTRGFDVFNIFFKGSGSWILKDTLSAYYISLQTGEFNSNDKPVTTNYVYLSHYDFSIQTLKMGKSHWRINGNGSLAGFNYNFFIGPNAKIDAGMSLLEFTNTLPVFIAYADTKLYNVLFSNAEGTSTIRNNYEPLNPNIPAKTTTFNLVEIRNNGIMLGKSVVDSLIFTAGKSYDLDAAQAQTVNKYFQVIGNNCSPIELRSTAAGQKATVNMNGGKVVGDFIQMRDQRGVGTTKFFAGANSTNIGNSNQNWIFDSPVDYVDEGILGKDVVLCKNNSLTLDANTFNVSEKYRWNDGSTSATFKVNQAGTYNVAVTYGNGCVLRDTVKVLPAKDFTPNLINDTTLCSNQSLVLNADLKLLGATYRWQDGSTSASIKVVQPGKYKVTVELSGCVAADSTTVRIISPASINLGKDTTICDGQSLLLDAAKSGGRSYLWSDNSTATTLRVRTGGTFWVEVNDGKCKARDSIAVKLLPRLGLNLGKDSIFCEGTGFDLRSNLTNAVYRWQDGSSNAAFRVTVAGIYWLDATANGCTERDSVNLKVQTLPRFELGADTSLCQGLTYKLNGVVSTPGNVAYRWSNGSTTSSINLQSSGTYTLTTTLNTCTFSDQRKLSFNPGPSFELGANRGLCVGESYTMDLATIGASYLWSTGATTNKLKVTTTNTYFVDVIQNGCTKRDSIFISFAPIPKFTLGRDTTLCAGESLGLNATTTNATYRWNNGNTTATRTLTQTETAWADVTVAGCKIRDSIKVQFINLPKGLLGKDTTLCERQTLNLQINVPGASIRWQDNSTASNFLVTQAGAYSLQASAGRCSVKDTVQVAYKPIPVFSLGPDTILCNNETLSLNPTVAGGLYRWNDGQSTAPKQIAQTGTFWLEVNLNGCSIRDSVAVKVVNLPQKLLGKDTTLCEGVSLKLQVQAPGALFLWQDGSSASAFTVKTAGTFWAQAKAGRCQVRDSIVVAYNPLPRFNLGRDTVLCAGENLTLRAFSGADQLRWNPGANTSPSITVTNTGVYSVTAVLKGCSFADSIKVDFKTIPTIVLGKDTLACDNKPFELKPVVSANVKLLWQDGSMTPTLSATTPGTYWVKAFNDRCFAIDSLELSFRECIFFQAYTPNAFSPNGNNTNDVFKPNLDKRVQVKSYEFQVYDRWGDQVFRSTDLDTGWDGFIKGQAAPQGVYLYWFKIEYVDDLGPGNSLIRGEVNLLR